MISIETVRNSAKVTGTLLVIAGAAVLVRFLYSISDFDYFDMVKAFMLTKAEIGGVHAFLVNLAFWTSVIAAVVNAALNRRYGLSILSALWIPLLVMCGLALLFIPGAGLTDICLFWLICYVLVLIGLCLSARAAIRYCLENSNLRACLKDPEVKPELRVSRIDYTAAMLLALASCILTALVVIGALVFGIGNRDRMTGTNDIAPVVSSVRYDAAVRLMDAEKYEKAALEFRKLERYRDSRTLAAKCEDLLYRGIYFDAIKLMNQGEYDAARMTLRSISDYRDSEERIRQCDELQYGALYEEAAALMEEERYEEALAIFEMLRDVEYMDASEEILRCRSVLPSSLAGTWQGDAGSSLILYGDMTCHYVDGGGATGNGTWDVADGRLSVQTEAFSYGLYGKLDNGYLTTSILIQADSSSWRDEIFTKE